MINYLYPDKHEILNIVLSDIYYKNYNTLDYINGSSSEKKLLQGYYKNFPKIFQKLG